MTSRSRFSQSDHCCHRYSPAEGWSQREDEAAERMRGSHNGTKSCRTGPSRPWKRAVMRRMHSVYRVTSIRQLKSDKYEGNVRFTAMYFL